MRLPAHERAAAWLRFAAGTAGTRAYPDASEVVACADALLVVFSTDLDDNSGS